MTRMTQAAMLLEQARILRAVAVTFEREIIRDDLLKLAKKCEQMAKAADVSAEDDGKDESVR